MMSRNPQLPAFLALSLLLPWCATGDALAATAPDTVRRTAAGGRVVTKPMRASGARTRAEGLGVRDASPHAHAPRAAEGAVTVQPMSPVHESAALLMRLPPGRRVVHIAGFAGDITAYGDARSVGSTGGAQPGGGSGSGLQRGIEQVRDRVLHRMKALRAAGARIDLFSVEHPASLPLGPFGDMVLAEAIDSAVLEVFPRAQPPQRADDGLADGSISPDDPDEGALASDSDSAIPAADVARVASDAPSRAATGSSPMGAQPRAEVVHWETSMRERGIQWDRIMDDTREGTYALSARRAR